MKVHHLVSLALLSTAAWCGYSPKASRSNGQSNQALTASSPSPSAVPSPSWTQPRAEQNTLRYDGYTIEKRTRRVKLADTEKVVSRSDTIIVTYARLKRRGRVVATFDANIYFGLGNTTRFGLFPILGGIKKQLIVSQDIPRGGTQWIVSLSPKFHVIFDGPKWGVGREGDDMQIVDLDHDGAFEILVPITAFYGFSAWIPTGRTPLPIVIFKYDPKRKKYLPANLLFHDYLLDNIEQRKQGVSSSPDPVNQPTQILPIVLDYIFAGKEQEAWTFFEESYKLSDKQEMKARIRAVIKDHPVYCFIYKKTAGH